MKSSFLESLSAALSERTNKGLTAGKTSYHPPTRAKRRRGFRLGLETLEDRVVPTIAFAIGTNITGLDILGNQLSNQTVHLVFWTGQPSQFALNGVMPLSDQQISNTETAVENLLASPYLSALPGGSNGVATYDGAVFDRDPLPAQVSENAIQNEVTALHLTTGPDNSHIYIFVTPTNWAVTDDFKTAGGKNWDHNSVGLIWYGSELGLLSHAQGLNESGSSVDNISLTLGHEIAECMSSPDDKGYQVATYFSGTNIPDPTSLAQICDGLQSNYYYRESNGILVEPYFTGTSGLAVVPDGYSDCNFVLAGSDPNNPNNSKEQNTGYDLGVGRSVSGDPAENGQFDISTATASWPWGPQQELVITANGQTARFDAGTINSIHLDLDPGMANTITLHGIPAGIKFSVDEFSPAAGTGTSWTLKVDATTPGSHTLQLTDTSLTLDGNTLQFHDSQTDVNHNTVFYPPKLELDIRNTTATIQGNPDTSTTVVASGGNNKINVQQTAPWSTLNINAGNGDNITLGQSGVIDAIAPTTALTITGGSLTVDASKEPDFGVGVGLSISGTGLSFHESLSSYWSVAYSGLRQLTVNDAPLSPSMDLSKPSCPVTLTGGAQTKDIYLDAGSDPSAYPITVNPANGATVHLFPTSISSAPSATGVTVDDSLDGAMNEPITILNNQVDYGSANAPLVTINYPTTAPLTVIGGPQTPSIAVASTSVSTTIKPLGSTTVTLAPTLQTLDSIGRVIVNGSGVTPVIVNDSKAAGASGNTRYYHLNATTLTWQTIANSKLPQLGKAAPTASSSLTFSALGSLSVTMSSKASQMDIEGTSAATTTIQAGSGATMINLAPFSESLSRIGGQLILDGGGNSTINLNDQKGTSSSSPQYTLGWGTFSRQVSGGQTNIQYSNAGVNFWASTGNANVISIQGTALQPATGGMAPNALTVNAGTSNDQITVVAPAVDDSSLGIDGFFAGLSTIPTNFTIAEGLVINADNAPLTVDGSGIQDQSQPQSEAVTGAGHNVVQFTVTDKAITYNDNLHVLAGTSVQLNPRPQPVGSGRSTFHSVEQYSQFTSTITYNKAKSVVIQGGPVDTTFNVQATGSTTPVTITGRQGTAYSAAITTAGNLTGAEHVVVSQQSSKNAFNIGNGGSVKSVQSAVTLTGFASDTVLVDDSKATTMDQVTIGNGPAGDAPVGKGTKDTLFGTGGSLDCTNIGQLTLNLSQASGDTISASPSPVTTYFLNGNAAEFPGITAASLKLTGIANIPAPIYTAPGTGYYTLSSPLQTVNFSNMKSPGTALSIKHLSPASGLPMGGTSIVITGTGFTNVTGVSFGGIPAVSYVVNSPTRITAVAPAESASMQFVDPVNRQKLNHQFAPPSIMGGTVRVTVITQAGPSAAVTADLFKYLSNKPALAITWALLPPITYGTPLSSAQLDATASVPGSFTYTPAATTVLDVGMRVLQATFTPRDTTDYPIVHATMQLLVNPAPLTVQLNPITIANGTVLDNRQLSGTANATVNGQLVPVPATYSFATAAGVLLDPGVSQQQVVITPDNPDYATVTMPVMITVSLAPTQAAVNPINLVYGTAFNNSQLSGTATAVYDGQTFNVPGTFAYTSVAGAVPAAGQGQTVQVTFTPTVNLNFGSAQVPVAVNVAQATPQVTVNPVNIVYGTAIDNSQLTGTATAIVNGQTVSVPGTFSYSANSLVGSVLAEGTYPGIGITFTPSDTTDFQVANTTTTVTVAQASPVVTLNPVNIVYGTVLDNSQLAGSATAVKNGQTVNVAGTFAYATAAGILLGAGQGQTETVTFTPNDSVHFSTEQASVTINVAQAGPQVVANPVTINYGRPLDDGQLTGTATAVVNGQTTDVAGSFFYLGGVGTVLSAGAGQIEPIYFVPQDGVDFRPVVAAVVVNVNRISPVVLTNPVNINYGTPLENSQLSGTTTAIVNGQTVNVPGSFVYYNTVGDILSTGMGQFEVVNFFAADSTDFSPVAAAVIVNVTGAPTVPTLTVNPVNIGYGVPLDNSQLSGTATAVVNGQTGNVTGTYTFASAAGTILNAGLGQSALVTFTPDDSIDFGAAQANVTINVYQDTPQVTVNPISFAFGTAFDNSQLSGTATAVVDGQTVNVPGVFAYSDSTFLGSVLGPPAQYSIGVTFTPNDTTDFQTVETNVAVTVSKATPQVSANTVNISTGTALANSQLSGAASAVSAGVTFGLAGTFSYTTAAGTVLGAGDGQSEQVTFTPADSTDYNAVTTNVTINVTTVRTTPQVAVNPVSLTYGTAFTNSQLSGSATVVVNGVTTNVPGTFTYTSVAGQVYGAGSHQTSVTFTPNDTTSYSIVQRDITVSIARATPQVSVSQVNIEYGVALANTQLKGKGTATAIVNGQTVNIAGVFTYTSTVGTILHAGTDTVAVTFTPNDGTDFNLATTTVTVAVRAATPVISTPTSSANPCYVTTSTVVFTVIVQAPVSGTPQGTVTFYDGDTVLGTVYLQNVNGLQQASYTVSFLTPGTHSITAKYTDTLDNDFTDVTSAALQQVVNPLG